MTCRLELKLITSRKYVGGSNINRTIFIIYFIYRIKKLTVLFFYVFFLFTHFSQRIESFSILPSKNKSGRVPNQLRINTFTLCRQNDAPSNASLSSPNVW